MNKKLLLSLLNKGSKEGQSFTEKFQIQFHNIISYLAIPVIFGFIIIDFQQRNYQRIVFYILLLLGVLAIILTNWYTKKATLVSNIFIISSLSYLLITGGIQSTGIIWFITAPPVFFFTNKIKTANFTLILLFLILITTILSQGLSIFTTPYSNLFISQVTFAVALVSLIMFIYSKV
ncbi:hypothetical protein HY008_02715, partial [Candidatus Woesebacteria bacterium]|nr:hypothetical protein [Candidatus Woesebacteria bacterium]